MTGETLTIGGLFLEGLLSFFSPCVLPLIPLYIGYLTANVNNENNMKRRFQTAYLTFFFILGISTVFFVAGLGASALNTFVQNYRIQFTLFSGVLLILLSFFSLGIIQIPFLEKERKITQISSNGGILNAFLLGFFFSFAWSPCIGPLLASAILAAAGASSKIVGMLYIGAYALGFIVVFILIGLFADEVLIRLKKYRSVVKYTQKIGALMILVMGCWNLWTANQQILSLSNATVIENTETQSEPISSDALDIETYDFTLLDKDGNAISLSDYKGKKIIVNFFGTWCYYCNLELPHLQEIKDTNEDVVILLIAAPGLNQEGDIDYVEEYMANAGYDMQIVYDQDYSVTRKYGISGYPTTYIMQKDGNFLGYMPGYMEKEMLLEILDSME